MPLDPKLGPHKPPETPAWLTLLRKIVGWNPPGYKDPTNFLRRDEPQGAISEARNDRPRIKKLKLNDLGGC